MERIYKSALKLMAPLTLEEVCQRSVEEGCKLLDARYGSVFWLVDSKLRRLFTTVPRSQQLEPRPQGNTVKVLNTLRPRVVSSSELDKSYPKILETGIKSFILIPLSYAGKPLGVMALQSSNDHKIHMKDSGRIKLFGSVVSLAIRNVQLFEQKNEALNQRDLFMSLASHELKTPLAVVIMTLHLMERKMKNGATWDPKWVETIKRNANKLKVLIDDLFSISEINAGTIRIRRSYFSIVAMCEKVITELSAIYPQQIKFKNKIDNERQLIHTDEEKISLVLTNIISNAAKFSAENSTITVTLAHKWSGIEIKIQDQGIGIDEVDLKRVFDRYFQGKNRRNGLGLGLFLSREIIEAHDGEIQLTSKKGKGTTVSIWLPIS